jgi:hypothetical protein
LRILLILLYLCSFLTYANEKTEYQGIYEGVKLFKNMEVQGTSYVFVDLLSSKGTFSYKADIASDEKGLNCTIDTKNIIWNAPVANIPLLNCGWAKTELELILILDVAMLKGSTYSLNSKALITLVYKQNDVAVEMVSMWLLRTEKNLLLNQLKNAVPYGK